VPFTRLALAGYFGLAFGKYDVTCEMTHLLSFRMWRHTYQMLAQNWLNLPKPTE
jgi:hypothetical protein